MNNYIFKLLKDTKYFLSKYLFKSISTHHTELSNLSKFASDREIDQLSMYVEVFLKIKDVPGEILEFGVGSGISFKFFTRLNNRFNYFIKNKYCYRNIYGFDSFEGLPEPDQVNDLVITKGLKFADMRKGGFNSNEFYDDLIKFTKKNENCSLIKGWFNETLPQFLEDKPDLSIGLLHIDCDLYDSTKTVLDKLLSKVSIGGIILFDEIHHKLFPGETIAFNEEYKKTSKDFTLKFYRVSSMPWKWYAIRIN